MSYFDCYLVPVKKQDKEKYHAHTHAIDTILKEHGAVRTCEFWGDDLPEGKRTSFHLALDLQADETAVLGFMEWPSKQAYEDGMQAVDQDERLNDMDMPFDGGRMIFGGFEPIIEQ